MSHQSIISKIIIMELVKYVDISSEILYLYLLTYKTVQSQAHRTKYLLICTYYYYNTIFTYTGNPGIIRRLGS